MRGCLAIVLLAIIAISLAVVMQSLDGGSSDPPSPARRAGSERFDRELEARSWCIEAVTAQLRSPSSADFIPPMSIAVEGQLWTLSGRLDAQNAFGATVRSIYRCQLEHLAGSEWRTISAELR